MALHFNGLDEWKDGDHFRVTRDPLPSENWDKEDLNADGTVDVLSPKHQTIIFMTMFTKIGRVTEDNVAEFYARCSIIEQWDGSHCYEIVDGKKKDVFVTPEDCNAAIGLTTNVSTESREKFLNDRKRIMKEDMDRHLYDYERKLKPKVPA